MAQDKRLARRSKVMLMVAVRFAGDPRTHRLRLRDIAPGGVRLSCGEERAPGQAATVEFAALGEIGGTVVWSSRGEIGIRFHHPIDPEQARLTVTGDFRSVAVDAPPLHLRRV